ncbi:hypothetical protein P175DRAFT_0513075 [Aspergillus ochraceoroseus IBT 24754]|uniref:Protease inhibitor (Tfs1) n=2 Tax=Aspergillus subgen. Nidulantes TaxID=2720870 RepID=A0A0F8WDS6_9EURO|nr:uncharacterized protein P175DRAFT_0513075 [Aspergillus ochraceoroseus IBT 24754]KKK16035.1 hypothetical protein ARAM_004612 [Aspergillus rambellii]PTU23973.1 hypothetical protein P175DRAFT_0513075 [Aspergillus ochraceoroseus IBT 24754]
MPANHSIKKALSLIQNDASKVLGLNVGRYEDVQPGQYIPRADAQSHPDLFSRSLSPSSTYMVVGLDIDAPFPSFGVLGPILHWIQGGLQPTPSECNPGIYYTLEVTAPFVANYIGPAPPPGSSPHRYIFILYEQPAGFDAKKYAPPNGQNLGNIHRMRYNLDAWEKEIQLGPIVAANYFKSN